MTDHLPANRILIVDDHPIVREGLTLYLSAQPDFSVCGEAATVDDAFQLAQETTPDLVLIDVSLKEGNGLDLVRRIKSWNPSMKMVVLSGLPVHPYAERSLRAGAQGYVDKQDSQEAILKAIRTVLAGRTFCSGSAVSTIHTDTGSELDRSSQVDTLSSREREIFDLIGQGVSTGHIAKRLFLSTHTIDTHRENIKRKLGLKSAGELTTAAVQFVLGRS